MRLRLQQKSRSLNLKYASKDLRCDRAVVLTAMINHSGSLIHCLDSDLREEVTLFYYFIIFSFFFCFPRLVSFVQGARLFDLDLTVEASTH